MYITHKSTFYSRYNQSSTSNKITFPKILSTDEKENPYHFANPVIQASKEMLQDAIDFLNDKTNLTFLKEIKCIQFLDINEENIPKIKELLSLLCQKENLMPNLTFIGFYRIESINSNFTVLLEPNMTFSLSELPSTIKSLVISAPKKTIIDIKLLPSNLTSLSLEFIFPGSQIYLSDHFPENLISLSLEYVHGNTLIKLPNYFPNTLSKLLINSLSEPIEMNFPKFFPFNCSFKYCYIRSKKHENLFDNLMTVQKVLILIYKASQSSRSLFNTFPQDIIREITKVFLQLNNK